MLKMLKWAAPLVAAVCLLTPLSAQAAGDDLEALRQELKALREKVVSLEKKLEESQKIQGALPDDKRASAELQEPRAEQPGLISDLDKRVKLYGGVEVWGQGSSRDVKANNRKTSSSEFKLRKAEVFMEAQINPWAKGLIHLLWEQDKTEPVDLDEGYILLGQTNDVPFYALGGRIYPAIGHFESFLITDTITREAFETQATALEAGYANDWINLGLAAFRGNTHEISDGEDRKINAYFAHLGLATPEGFLGDLKLSGHIAYMSNLDSGFIRDQIADNAIQDLVGAWSAEFKAEYGMFAMIAEYMRVTDSYKAGALGYAPAGAKPEPYAYNLEAAVMPWSGWTFAVRHEGSGDLYGEQPERQWGLGAKWEFLKDTTLGLEYMRGDYQNNDTRDLVTTQLAVKF